jgi:hypothetical protein
MRLCEKTGHSAIAYGPVDNQALNSLPSRVYGSLRAQVYITAYTAFLPYENCRLYTSFLYNSNCIVGQEVVDISAEVCT